MSKERIMSKDDGKGFEICTAGLEFESGCAPFERIWNSRGFTPLPGSTKCDFQEVRFPRIQKKKKELVHSTSQ